MLTLAIVFVASVVLGFGFLALRAAEIRAQRRFVLAGVRRTADGWVEHRAHAAGARFKAAEHRAIDWLRATPHRLADFAAFLLRLIATRALRTLRWLHERRAHGHAPASIDADGSKGSVSFFVSALGDTRHAPSQAQTRVVASQQR